MARVTIPLCVAFIFGAGPALAQAQSDPPPVRITITKTDCSRLVRHVPADDVTYRPGEGVRGRRVAPADLPGSGANAIPNLIPDVLEFPISINPVSYAARNKAQADLASAKKSLSDNYNSKVAAENQITTLQTQLTTLNTTATTLATEKATLDGQLTTATNTLTALQAQVDAGTLAKSSRDYVLAKQDVASKQAAVDSKAAEITANTAQITANNTATSTQQAIVNASSGNESNYNAAAAAAEGKLAAISAKGLDQTSMTVGVVRYDMLKGIFTFNGEPMGGEDQAALAEACAKRGVR
ncbi:MAG: hypothetical protein AB7G62_06580 [Magnetospirillum sp.]